jgi:hypothetical protein
MKPSAVEITGVKNMNDINKSRGLFFYILDESDEEKNIQVSVK